MTFFDYEGTHIVEDCQEISMPSNDKKLFYHVIKALAVSPNNLLSAPLFFDDHAGQTTWADARLDFDTHFGNNHWYTSILEPQLDAYIKF